MTAPVEFPFQPSGMPKLDKTPADVAAWSAAQPDFVTDPMRWVGGALSAWIEWDLAGNGAQAGFWQEVEVRLRILANSPHVGLATPEQRARYGL